MTMIFPFFSFLFFYCISKCSLLSSDDVRDRACQLLLLATTCYCSDIEQNNKNKNTERTDLVRGWAIPHLYVVFAFKKFWGIQIRFLGLYLVRWTKQLGKNWLFIVFSMKCVGFSLPLIVAQLPTMNHCEHTSNYTVPCSDFCIFSGKFLH